MSDTGIVRFRELLGIDHAIARDIVSDHAPIYLTTGDASARFAGVEELAGEGGQSDEASCIDLDTATLAELDRPPLGER